MQRNLFLAGLLGLLLGIAIYAGACFVSTRLPILLQHPIVAGATFLFFLALSAVEIPVMFFGLRQIARSATTPRAILISTFAIFVMFASVYASIFVLLTGQIGWGGGLALLSVARFASGVWMR
jgi:hypothetical protein